MKCIYSFFMIWICSIKFLLSLALQELLQILLYKVENALFKKKKNWNREWEKCFFCLHLLWVTEHTTQTPHLKHPSRGHIHLPRGGQGPQGHSLILRAWIIYNLKHTVTDTYEYPMLVIIHVLVVHRKTLRPNKRRFQDQLQKTICLSFYLCRQRTLSFKHLLPVWLDQA